uniref:Uncharacterized protein n=1 Tax=Pygoscelis antarcticus TaxID=79643 RepID=A0A7G7LKG7_PYGAN|nr:hypothetical protein [Pygoscelis antarcticus]
MSKTINVEVTMSFLVVSEPEYKRIWDKEKRTYTDERDKNRCTVCVLPEGARSTLFLTCQPGLNLEPGKNYTAKVRMGCSYGIIQGNEFSEGDALIGGSDE